MCGIIGINSNKAVSSTIISSLKKLEYRGYDSAGIATLSNNKINEIKSEGRVDKLESNSLIKNMEGTIGIGHVRWATHGLPNSINAHPHSSQNVSVVHNGIIENSTQLKKFLVGKGHKFKSQTDTEVIVHLITENLKTENIVNSVQKTKLSNSCDVSGLETSVCLMAASIAGEENELSMGAMTTTSTQLLLMLEPSTTAP